MVQICKHYCILSPYCPPFSPPHANSSTSPPQPQGLTPGRTYHLRVLAVNPRGASPPSPTLSITTLQEPPTAPPTHLTARPHSSRAAALTLSWQVGVWVGDVMKHFYNFFPSYFYTHTKNCFLVEKIIISSFYRQNVPPPSSNFLVFPFAFSIL